MKAPPRKTPPSRIEVSVARVYGEDVANLSGHKVLVDRLWPRGLRRDLAPFDEWARDVAPTTELRKWYGHAPERFAEFAERYRKELDTLPARPAVERLRTTASRSPLILLTATKDLEYSGAFVLCGVISHHPSTGG